MSLAHAQTGQQAAALKIMYVDDEQTLAQLAQRLLLRMGYEPSTFCDPRAALAAFKEDPARFDAVITDLAMPHMTGFDLAHALRAIRADLPLVLTSGCIRKEEEDNALRLGVQHILAKPATLEEFRQALAVAMALARPQPVPAHDSQHAETRSP